MRKVPRVLMLGWEFPPVINGGLGVACHDLSSAMSEMAEITMVVPKTSPGFKMKNMNLVGINNVRPQELQNYPSNYRRPLPFKLHFIPADLNPYASSGKKYMYAQNIIDELQSGGMEAFDIDSLYGGDVINKVLQYADIAASLASNMDFDVI